MAMNLKPYTLIITHTLTLTIPKTTMTVFEKGVT